MDHEDEFIYIFFTHISQLCFDKAKEHVVSGFPIGILFLILIFSINLKEKERETCRNAQLGPWSLLLAQLPQVALAEKSYMELGFLQNKNKGFLRKDVCTCFILKYNKYFMFEKCFRIHYVPFMIV